MSRFAIKTVSTTTSLNQLITGITEKSALISSHQSRLTISITNFRAETILITGTAPRLSFSRRSASTDRAVLQRPLPVKTDQEDSIYTRKEGDYGFVLWHDAISKHKPHVALTQSSIPRHFQHGNKDHAHWRSRSSILHQLQSLLSKELHLLDRCNIINIV